MSRLLFCCQALLLAGLSGCSCSRIPESPPAPGPAIQLQGGTTVSPDGTAGGGTTLDQPVIPLPDKKK